MKLSFSIQCSLRLGTFPGCQPDVNSRTVATPEARQLSGVITTSNYNWSDTWTIETPDMTIEEAIELTQDGVLLYNNSSNLKYPIPDSEVILDTGPMAQTLSQTQNQMQLPSFHPLFTVLILFSAL